MHGRQNKARDLFCKSSLTGTQPHPLICLLSLAASVPQQWWDWAILPEPIHPTRPTYYLTLYRKHLLTNTDNFPGEGNGNPPQHSCLGTSMDRGAWWATVHEVKRVALDLVTKPPPETISTQVKWKQIQSPEGACMMLGLFSHGCCYGAWNRAWQRVVAAHQKVLIGWMKERMDVLMRQLGSFWKVWWKRE